MTRLLRALKIDLANFLADNLAFFQQFDKVKVYYDNGQSEVTRILHDAVEFALSRKSAIATASSPLPTTASSSSPITSAASS
ncbi:MAG: hypothetical protein ACLSDQ_07405 [Adlercreutzia equolifaciens]